MHKKRQESQGKYDGRFTCYETTNGREQQLKDENTHLKILYVALSDPGVISIFSVIWSEQDQ